MTTKEIELFRLSNRADGTPGVLLVNTAPICVTLERPWFNNQKGISCIPTGIYICSRVKSPKFGDTFEVTFVTGRSEILFHSGNIDDDSHGCILLGESFNKWTTGQVSIASSKIAFAEFMQELVEQNTFRLTISQR
jgi:hypothetical protein